MPIICPRGFKVEISQILQAALNSVDPYQIVKKRLKKNGAILSIGNESVDLDLIDQVFIIGFGKAVLPMAKAILDVMGDKITSGILIPKHHDLRSIGEFPDNLMIFSGEHPIPTNKSLIAAKKISKLMSMTTENDLVIGLISGGGSSLVTLPIEPAEVEDLNILTQSLLRSGASINEINTVRKHLDQIKGGGLLRCIYPAMSIHLILSDVIGDDLSVIASGPTSPDPTTFSDAINVLKRYDLEKNTPVTIRQVLYKGNQGEIPETIKNNDPLLEKTSNQIIGSLKIAAHAAKQEAESLNFQTEILDLALMGEAKIAGKMLARHLIKRKNDLIELKIPLCIIAGGETTVTVSGKGKGGRNQEFALAAALELDGIENVHFVTFASDGEDGPTEAAGAYVDGQTVQRAKKLGLNAQEYLTNNDTYNFFIQTGELLFSGPTGTNVNDLVFMLVFP
jgi:glycerate-2-kinase